MPLSKKNKMISEILKVSVSNILKLLSGVLVGVLLPKIMGVTDYGYYKTFTLYIHYTGLFHFGLSDGIYLLYGGNSYKELNVYKFRLFTMLFITIELVITIILFSLSYFVLSDDSKFIFCCVALFLLANNITSYFQMISQITERFDELARRNIIQSILISLCVLILFVFSNKGNQEISYRIYIIIYLSVIFFLAIWYGFTYKTILIGPRHTFDVDISEIKQLFRLGAPLLVSNLCSTLLLSLDRQFVSVLFDTDTYAIYAFAYNLLALVTTAVSAISTVIYPKMKRTSSNVLFINYNLFNSIIQILVFSMLILYYPLCFFVKLFLPKYLDSLAVFRIIFPGLAISSSITIVMHNYYKVLGISTQFFINSLIALAVSILTNFIAYFSFKTTESISIASIITMLLWYWITEKKIVRMGNISTNKNAAYLIVMIAFFYISTSAYSFVIGAIMYSIFLFCTTCLFFKSDIGNIVHLFHLR